MQIFSPSCTLAGQNQSCAAQTNQAAVAAQAAAAAAVMVSGARAPPQPEARAPGAAPSARARARISCLAAGVGPGWRSRCSAASVLSWFPRPARFVFVLFRSLPPSLRSTISKSLRRAQGSQGRARSPSPAQSASRSADAGGTGLEGPGRRPGAGERGEPGRRMHPGQGHCPHFFCSPLLVTYYKGHAVPLSLKRKFMQNIKS